MHPTTHDFVNRVLSTVLSTKDAYDEDNVDRWYPPPGYEESDTPRVAADRKRFLQFFLEHAEAFERLPDSLEDERSRKLLRSLVLFRLLGYRKAKVAVDRTAFYQARAASIELAGEPSTLQIEGDPALMHFHLAPSGNPLYVDCLRANAFFSFFLKQYYFERDDVRICPEPGDFVIDAGACFGDTAIGFADSIGDRGRVYSFEVLAPHLEVIRHNLKQNPDLSNIVVLPVALGDTDKEGQAAVGPANPGYSLLSEGDELPMRSLDSLVADRSIPRVDFIKMDIEGFELTALQGAAETIRMFRPKLAISIYHNWEDYLDIPEFIRSIEPSYRMYLDNYTLSDGETILYATCSDPSRS